MKQIYLDTLLDGICKATNQGAACVLFGADWL